MAAHGGRIPATHRRVLRDIATCRTAAMGGHVEQCNQCGHEVIAYNSCRNRHCPKCQAAARADWFDRRQLDLLPVEYFHVVFTVPQEIARIALQNKKVVYDILFRSAAETLQQVAADSKHLGAKIGILAVLHTWGQALDHHPHIHCIVPGGGISPDCENWMPCRPGFFLPVPVLRSLFRGKVLHHLRGAFMARKLSLHGAFMPLNSGHAFRAHLSPLYQKDWVVYAKPPFGGPAQVLKYLARYTHRVAIANSRLVGMHEDKVSFTWKDYAHGSKQRVMTLQASEFLRRFLLHVLPRGFVRIRYYGFLANRCREKKLELARRLLNVEDQDGGSESIDAPQPLPDSKACPQCKQGTMVCVLTFLPASLPVCPRTPVVNDTS